MPGPAQFDGYLKHEGPAALVIREYLMPAEGPDGVIFPATYAGSAGQPGGYCIHNGVALIDSVGSQANRIEPIFGRDEYKHLVPQYAVTAGDKTVSILDAGHRAGDALIRCSSLGDQIQAAFKEVLKGNDTKLAKLAPTSLVFGVWDSRDTQAKRPRLVASTIRALDVEEFKRSAQYNPPLDYSELNVFSEEDKKKAEGDTKNPLAIRGFVHVPAAGTHGGVIARGGVLRTATLALAALRMLNSGTDVEQTLTLRRYILGLSLVAFTYSPSGYLRQGCLLVSDKSKPYEFVEVHPNGDRKPLTLTHADALAYATAAAKEFGVEAGKPVPFEVDRARRDVGGDGESRAPAGRRGRGRAAAAAERPAEAE